MILSIKNKAPLLLLLFGMGMVSSGLVIAYKTKRTFDNSAFWAAHTHDVILATNNVLSLIKDVQIAGRGYAITGDGAFLEPVNRSAGLIAEAIQKLKILTVDNPYQQSRIDSAAQMTRYIIDYIVQYTELRKEKGFTETSAIFESGQGKLYLNSLKHLLGRIEKVEYKLLELRRAANQKSIDVLTLIFVFLFGSQALFIGIISFTVGRNINTWNKTEKVLALYESIIQSSDDAIISKDLNGIITSWNHGAENIFNYSAKEVLGKPISILIPPDRLNEEFEIMNSIKRNKSIDPYDTERLRKDGSIVHISLTLSPLRDSMGNVVGASKIARDITQRKINEEALKRSLKDISDYKYALDESAIVAITDQRGMIRHVNKNFCKISKYTASELIGQDHRIINSGYHPKEFIRDLWITITSGKIWKGELKNKAKDGATYWVDTTIVPFLNEQGKPYQYVAIRADITDRKRAEEENERSEIRFRSTLDKMLEGVEILNFDCRYLYVNDAYEKQVKLTKSELLGHTIMEKFSGIENTNIFKAIQRCFDERIIIHIEEEFTFPDSTKTWFEISFQPISEGVFILSVDITEKNQAAEKIRRSEERFRSLIENSYDIVSIIDKEFIPHYRSPAAIRITGWTNEDLEKNGSVEQTHPDDLAKLKSVLIDVMNNPGIPFEISFRTKHKAGHYIFIEGLITNLLHNEAIKGIVTNFRDVTETRKAEEKIKESEKIYKTIASSIPGSVIFLVDKDYRYFLIEGDMLESMGYSKEKLLGNKITDVIPPDRLKEMLPHFQRVLRGESFKIETFREGFDILSRFVPLRDENNSVFAAMVVMFDISELKNAQRAIAELNVGLELKIKERTFELEMVNKELEAFSYSVAHDLRTPLRAVLGYATMLDEDYGNQLDDGGNRLIGEVEGNAKKMGTLIDNLLAFSRLGRKEIRKSLVDMSQLSEACLHDLQLGEEYPGKIKIKKLHHVMADPSLMKHVIINLLGNAIKYSSKKESPIIEMSSRQENQEIIYAVADNGVGFDMAYAGKLFGVFQRLHSDEEFDGTGVGLAIVQRIIHRHHGRIWAESKVDEGATFYFSLPVVANNN